MHRFIYILLLFFTACQEKPSLEISDKTLTVYTYDSFAADWGPAPKIKEAFEKSCDCKVNFVGISSSIGALRKIQLEGKNTKADILLGLDTATAELAKKTGLFAYHDNNLSQLKSLPIDYHDKTFVPFDFSYHAFVYDSNKVKNPPHSFEELASMPKDFKIVIQDPRSSTPGLGLLLWVKEIYGDKAGAYWKRLSPHILTITKGWSEAYNLFLKGEADMVLSYTTSPAYHALMEKKDNYKAAIFDEGHYLQIEVAGMLKSSKHPALAKQFLRFLNSATFAHLIPDTNWAYPVVQIKSPLPFDVPIPKKVLLWDGKKVESQRKVIIDEWLEAIKK